MHDASLLIETVRRAKRIYIIGNGGSYANTMHLCNDLLACRLKAYCCDPATLSAFANDYGWDQALARWISIVGEKGDVLIALSGSGKSKNILNAIRMATRRDMTVYKLFGNERQQTMQQAEEFQLHAGHEVYRCFARTR